MTAARLLGNAAEENNFRSISCPRDAPEPLQRQPQIAAVFCVSVRIAQGENKYITFVSFFFHLLVCDLFTLIGSLADVFMSNQFSVRVNKTNKLNVNVLLSPPFCFVFHRPAICQRTLLSKTPLHLKCVSVTLLLQRIYLTLQCFMCLTPLPVQTVD